jgi:proline dehydrogenase
VAGDTLDDGVAAALSLGAEGFLVSLDLLGEEVVDVATATAARDAYVACVHRIASDGIRGNISIKLSQLGLAFDVDVAAAAVDDLARAAAAAGTTVTIDMEDSRFTDATLDVYEAAQRRHGNLGVCLQAALRRTPDDLERILPLGGMIRLCKGAYVEPSSIAHQGPEMVETAFLRLLERLMGDERVRPAIATHDDVLLSAAARLAAGREAPFEFQMLYGVRGPLQRDLRARGFDLRVYLPYGSRWYAYLTRRLAERPANTMFFLRALVGRS